MASILDQYEADSAKALSGISSVQATAVREPVSSFHLE